MLNEEIDRIQVKGVTFENFDEMTLNNINYSKNYKKYTKLVNKLHEYFKYLEQVNFEVEKLAKIYIENYIEKKENLNLNHLMRHRKMLIIEVFSDNCLLNLIRFILCLYDNSEFLQKKEIYWKLEEIYDSIGRFNDAY